ncbi:MAG: FtsQ-type POTRA domain-containing protein [Patescibacteria group bacterium]|nr:FtsQ-type POTRA domain-containing protein [Patescibacteria group bacterium]
MAKYTSLKAIERQKKRFWKRVVLIAVSLSLFLFLISWLSSLEKVNIRDIEITGNSIIEREDILEIVNKNISGKYFWLLSKSHILIYPKLSIRNELLESFSQIKNVTVRFKDFHSIFIDIVERSPYALWCSDMAGEHCYFMDGMAYLYDEAPNFSNDVYFKYLGDFQDISTTTPTSKILRRTYLGETGEEHFGKLNLFIRFLKDINIDGYKLIVKENNDYELFFNRNSRLIFDGKQDFSDIFEDLQAVLIDLGDLGDSEFEYIDLRFGHKVVYKFKE